VFFAEIVMDFLNLTQVAADGRYWDIVQVGKTYYNNMLGTIRLLFCKGENNKDTFRCGSCKLL
jgi:hypothetical protein